MFFTVLGLLGGLLIIVADIPYAINGYRRKTRPHRITWFTIFIFNAINLANQGASGAKNSLLFFIGATFITFIVFLVSVFNGVGGYSKRDLAVLAGIGAGLVLWWVLDTPVASIITNILVLSIAFIPTFVKAYHDPKSETKITWFIGAISSTLTAISVGKLDYILLALPLYATIQQASLFILLEIREKRLGL